MSDTTLTVTDTRSNTQKALQPLHDDALQLFVCGPTVYDHAHIGHGRTYIVFDVIVRYLRWRGFDVHYIQNITDVDDKIITRAQEEESDAQHLARTMEEHYHTDMQALRIDEEHIDYARASEHIPQIIDQIERLLAAEHAYKADDGSVYFSVPSFERYGQLSHQNLDAIAEAVRIEENTAKRHPADFAVWKGRPNPQPHEPVWDAPWGQGRPGWHIEDTAITEEAFGPQYDLHGGARDLLFPHHEGEIAIMESLSEQTPFVNHWLHTGLLNIRGEKMSKSKNNMIRIQDMLADHRPEAFRLLVLQAHYRSPLDYHNDDLIAAEHAVDRLAAVRDRLASYRSDIDDDDSLIAQTQHNITAAMDDDFQTPQALGTLFTLVRTLNERMDTGTLSSTVANAATTFLSWIDTVFAIMPPAAPATIPDGVSELVERREEARRAEDWETADDIRDQLRAMGWGVRDTEQGPNLYKR